MKKVDLNDYISNKGLSVYIFLDIDGVLNNENYILKCYNFIILDDDICDITPYFPNNIVHTNFKTGFTKRCLKQALKILKIKKESLLWKIIKS